MTGWQKTIQILGILFAVFLIVSIFGGIIGAVATFGVFDALFSGKSDTVLPQTEIYAVSQDVTAMDIQIHAATLHITEAAAFRVESNLKDLSVSVENGVLRIIESKRPFLSGAKNGAVTVAVPTAAVLQCVDIETGAGSVAVDALTTDRLALDLGAGKANLQKLTAHREADMDGGAGKLTVTDSTLHNLNLDLGVGKADITAALTGNSEISCGVGAAAITLLGEKADYRVRVEKGLGSATVDGNELSDGAAYGDGENCIDIDGGVGSITVSFS